MDVLKCLKLNKEFRTDGVSLRVQAWIPFLYEKHLIDEAIKLFYRNFLQLNV